MTTAPPIYQVRQSTSVSPFQPNKYYAANAAVSIFNKVYFRVSAGTALATFSLDFNNWTSRPSNSNTVSFLDVGLTPGDTIDATKFNTITGFLGAGTEAIRKIIVVPAGEWLVSAPLILPRYTSIYFESGAKLKATPGFLIGSTSNGKTVNAVLSGPTDSSVGYWEHGQIINPWIDAAGVAYSCIELWRFRFCEIINPTLWNGLRHGLKLNTVTESTSYELTLEGGRIYNQLNALNQLGYAGLEIQKCTDCEFRNLKVIGYDYGIHEDAASGSNFYNTVHVWNRPTQGSLHRAFWFQSNSGTAYGLYADTPVARSTVDPTLVDNTQDSYGIYVEGSGWTFNSCKVYVNNALDGNSYAYGGDNQTTGIYWAATAGSGYMDGCQFIGADATHRLKSGIGGPNKGSPTNIAPRYQNCAADARTTVFPQGVKFKSQGGPSFDFTPTDFDDGTGFGNLSVVMGAFPSPNGLPNASATKQSWVDFGISVGTTGASGLRIWDCTSNGGSVASAKIANQIGVNTINWLGHATTGAPIQFVVGRLSAAATQKVDAADRSTRAIAGLSVFDFQAPVTFGKPIHLPRFTTTERNALGVSAQPSSVIYNTTLGQWEYTDDGANWLPLSSSKEIVSQTAHGLSVGNNVRSTASGYVKAQANSAANAKGVSGRVVAVIDSNSFILQDSGVYGSGFTPGAEYWLSATTAGGDQTTAPSTTGQVQLPVGIGTPSGQFRILIQSGTVNP
jgi:hypothetical protein